MHLNPQEVFDIILLLSSGFLTLFLPYTPASQSLLLTVDVDTFLHDMDSVVAVAGDKIVLRIGKIGSIKQAVIQHNVVIYEFKWWYNATFWKKFYPCSVLKMKNAFKTIFQKISGYTKIKIT